MSEPPSPLDRVLARFAFAKKLSLAEVRVLDHACTRGCFTHTDLAASLGISENEYARHRKRILLACGHDYWRFSQLVIALLQMAYREALTPAQLVPPPPLSATGECPVAQALDEAGVERLGSDS